MFDEILISWRYLWESEPGKRFQERYQRLKARRTDRPPMMKVLLIIAGIMIIFIGMIFWLIPGSGWAIIILGAALLAGESQTVARMLDWLELKIRKTARSAKKNLDETK